MSRWRWMCSLRLAIEWVGNVNAELTRLYWSVGQQLAKEFGRGFEAKNLLRMVQFAQAFPEPEIVSTLSRQLSWSHVLALLPLKKKPSARSFYAQQYAEQAWSVRELRSQIERKSFERTEIASAQASNLTGPENATPALVFKDPYFLDFLGLRQGYDRALTHALSQRERE